MSINIDGRTFKTLKDKLFIDAPDGSRRRIVEARVNGKLVYPEPYEPVPDGTYCIRVEGESSGIVHLNGVLKPLTDMDFEYSASASIVFLYAKRNDLMVPPNPNTDRCYLKYAKSSYWPNGYTVGLAHASDWSFFGIDEGLVTCAIGYRMRMSVKAPKYIYEDDIRLGVGLESDSGGDLVPGRYARFTSDAQWLMRKLGDLDYSDAGEYPINYTRYEYNAFNYGGSEKIGEILSNHLHRFYRMSDGGGSMLSVEVPVEIFDKDIFGGESNYHEEEFIIDFPIEYTRVAYSNSGATADSLVNASRLCETPPREVYYDLMLPYGA